jgi:hypothetical protein
VAYGRRHRLELVVAGVQVVQLLVARIAAVDQLVDDFLLLLR